MDEIAIEVSPGQIWRDNNTRGKIFSRSEDSFVLICVIGDSWADCRKNKSIEVLKKGGGRMTRIPINRFNTNRKTGYTLVVSQ